MNLAMILRVLAMRRRLRGHERWSPDLLQEHQERALAELRRHALQHSRFYQRLHGGLERAPLAELPVVTKAMLMDRFDEAVVDPRLRISAVEPYLRALVRDDRFAGKYWISTTSGSSGRKSIVPSDVHEWSTIITSYARANEWAGIRTSLVRRVTMAVVSSASLSHQSARVAATVRSPFVVSHRFDAGQPLEGLVAALNELHPDVLVAYASMIRILAEEQLLGRLRIAPRGVNCSSEVLTAEARPGDAGLGPAPLRGLRRDGDRRDRGRMQRARRHAPLRGPRDRRIGRRRRQARPRRDHRRQAPGDCTVQPHAASHSLRGGKRPLVVARRVS